MTARGARVTVSPVARPLQTLSRGGRAALTVVTSANTDSETRPPCDELLREACPSYRNCATWSSRTRRPCIGMHPVGSRPARRSEPSPLAVSASPPPTVERSPLAVFSRPPVIEFRGEPMTYGRALLPAAAI